MTDELEYCKNCGEPTGRAGMGDDSLSIEVFTPDGNTDYEEPLCEECYYSLTKALGKAYRDWLTANGGRSEGMTDEEAWASLREQLKREGEK